MSHPGEVDGPQETEPAEITGGDTPSPQPPSDPPVSAAPEPRERIPSIPVLDVVLDPRVPADGARAAARASARAALSPERTAVYGLVAGLVLMAGTFAALIGSDQARTRALLDSMSRALPSARPAESAKAPASAAASVAPAPAQGPAPPAMPPAKPIAGPWRLSQLGTSPDVKIVEGSPDRRAFVDALADSGVPRTQVYRLINAFNGVHKFDKAKRHDTFSIALEIPTRKIRAFEYLVSPTEIYQAKENDEGALVGQRLDLHVEKKRAAGAIVVGDDLPLSLQSAGFEPSLVDELEDALEGRAQLRPGSRLRIVADYETALGSFARYLDILTVEYLSADPEANPLRVYHFKSDKAQGFFDAKGHQPYKGGFRSPIPFARISSRFNMRRMHPILHVIMPHNGVDFVAATGTPVYAASGGNIEWIGDSGPSGNLVTIRHANGITTGYAHLSRFAPHLSQGTPVETRQLVGYVGSTGRSTGPHLHFSAKRNGVFIDPLALKLDGDRVLPRSERAGFEEQRAALDKLLDTIPLPPAPEVTHAKETESDDEPLEEH